MGPDLAVSHFICRRDVQAIDDPVDSWNRSDALECQFLDRNAGRLSFDGHRAIIINDKVNVFQFVVEPNLAFQRGTYIVQD